MYSGIGDATGDDLPVRPADPGRFPAHKFKRLVSLQGYYGSNMRLGVIKGDESFFGIPWQAIERADLAPVATAVLRVVADRTRHGFTAKHFPVWLAMECGIILIDGGWRYAFPDKPRQVMDDNETARTFGVSEGTAREYRDRVTRALDEQWYWIHNYEM